jgi:hypothetical protein
MLSQERRRIAALYQYPDGFLNVGWFAGYLRRKPGDGREFQIQQTNLDNHNLDFGLRKNDEIPPQFHDLKPLRAICNLTGRVIGEDPVTKEPIRTVVATAVGFDVATVLDMPIDSAFDKIPVTGAPSTDFDSLGVRLFSGRDDKLSDSSNMVRLAGIIAATKFRAGRPDDGVRARCDILLRQKEDESQLIPIRYYGRLASAVYERVMRGAACEIVGRLMADVKRNGGAIDPETGIEPVTKIQFIECTTAPGVTTKNEIKVSPDWFKKMRQELQDAQMQRMEARKRRIAEQKEKVLAGSRADHSPVAVISDDEAQALLDQL